MSECVDERSTFVQVSAPEYDALKEELLELQTLAKDLASSSVTAVIHGDCCKFCFARFGALQKEHDADGNVIRSYYTITHTPECILVRSQRWR